MVVATVHTTRGLASAAGLPRRAVDVVELRLDCLKDKRDRLEAALRGIHHPILLTARHPSEGGAGALAASVRRDLLLEYLAGAALVDIELQSLRTHARVLQTARQAGVRVVLSFHDFRATPPVAQLRRKVRAAVAAGADVVKIATHLRGPQDLAKLLQLQSVAPPRPLALMGMGPLGRVSRLVLAAGGSRLNYGYLDRPQVSGQWPALELRAMFDKVLP